MQIRKHWEQVWFSWGLFYLVLSLICIFAVSLNENLLAWIGSCSFIVNALNNLTTCFLFLCYIELAFPTREEGEWAGLPPLYFLLLLVLVLAVAEVSWRQWVMDQKNLLFGEQMFGWLSGFAQGVLIALVVGRLDSKFIEPPTLITVMLYLYATIQGLLSLFAADLLTLLFLSSLAFFLKVVFFIYLAWLLASGVLVFYLAEVRHLHLGVDEQRSEFVGNLFGPDELAAE